MCCRRLPLPDVAGWQALNLAGLTEDRIERVVSWLPDDTFSLDTISAELNRVFASVHMSEPVSSTPAIRAPRTVSPHHRWGQSRPTFAAERTPQNILLRPHRGTRLRRLSIPRTRTMTAVTPVIQAICKNTCEMNSRCWPPAWTMVKMIIRFQVWTIHSWKQHA